MQIKRIVIPVCLLLLMATISACESFTVINDPVSTGALTYQGIMEKENSDLSDIAVTFSLGYKSENHQNATVYVKNNSDSIFSGRLIVYFYDKESNIIGQVAQSFADIEPGDNQRFDCNMAVSDSLKMEYSFWDYSFPVPGPYGILDPLLTDSLKTYFKENFGNETIDWARASWYDSIISIEAYKNKLTYCAVITVDKTTKPDYSSIANAAHNYSKGFLPKIVIVDNSGSELYTYKK